MGSSPTGGGDFERIVRAVRHKFGTSKLEFKRFCRQFGEFSAIRAEFELPIVNSVSILIFSKCAVTRIRTWVIAATTQCTNHYTITAVRNSHIEFQATMRILKISDTFRFQRFFDAQPVFCTQ